MHDGVDRHFRMVDEQESIRRMEQAIDCLRKAGVGYVVEGGWAVAAYGSRVPSVDLDVLVPGGLTPEVAHAIEEATGLYVYAQDALERLSLDFADADHPNALIDRPDLSYTPSRLLDGGTQDRSLEPLSNRVVTVPEASRLAFMKLKAFHDRCIQWQAARGERYLLWGMPETERERTMRLGEDHWLRKAGKDLFDASFLCHLHTSLDAVRTIAPPAMWAPIRARVDAVPLPLRVFAQGMAQRSGVPEISPLGTA